MFQKKYLISLRDLCICVAYADRWAAMVFVVLAVLIENEEKQFMDSGPLIRNFSRCDQRIAVSHHKRGLNWRTYPEDWGW